MTGPATNAYGIHETSLYMPVKRFLESLDFVVKGEVAGCDVVGLRGPQARR